jgi:hypothetical protein
MNHRTRIIMLGAIIVAAGIAVAFLPPIPQPLAYHQFADQRTFLSLPNFFNVISNAPFLLVGVWGFLIVLGSRESEAGPFLRRAERWPYLILSIGVAMTCFGSAYYHLAPDNTRLVWDRLPITLGFMSVLSAVLVERVNLRAGLLVLGPLLALGLASVIQWYISELHGAGDLRFYFMVQFCALLLVGLIVWLFPARYTRGTDLAVGVGFYVLAKVLEALDKQIYALGHLISGHTLKHLAAALAVYWIFRMLTLRRPVSRVV